MFNCSQKHLFLQQACGLHPKDIDRAIECAMMNCRGETMNTKAHFPLPDPDKKITLGFGRFGLKKLSRQLSDKDPHIQSQAVKLVLDSVYNPEKASDFIDMFITVKLANLLKHKDSTIRENTCNILDILAKMYKGHVAIMKKPEILDSLMQILKVDSEKDVRYQAANCIQTLAMNYYFVYEFLLAMPEVIKDLLELINKELDSIVIIHLETLESLFISENEIAIQNGAFTLMVEHLNHPNTRVVCRALNCLTQLIQSTEGENIADEIDMIFLMLHFLKHKDPLIILAAVRVLMFSTLTTRSKWRARECVQLPDALVQICYEHKYPPMQLSCLQVLLNLSDNPGIRSYMNRKLLKGIQDLHLDTPEKWNGVLEAYKNPYENCEHHYRCNYLENFETIDNHFGDNLNYINVHSYLNKLHSTKEALINAIKWVPYISGEK